MKRRFNLLFTYFNWILVTLLSLLGFSGCEKYGAVEYGQPYTEYTLKGKVTDQAGKGIPGIEIEAKTGYDYSHDLRQEGVTHTNEQGDYQMTIDTFNQQSVGVYAKDVDGEENGSFQPDSMLIPKEKVILKEAKGWFNGRGSHTVHFTLNEKQVKDN